MTDTVILLFAVFLAGFVLVIFIRNGRRFSGLSTFAVSIFAAIVSTTGAYLALLIYLRFFSHSVWSEHERWVRGRKAPWPFTVWTAVILGVCFLVTLILVDVLVKRKRSGHHVLAPLLAPLVGAAVLAAGGSTFFALRSVPPGTKQQLFDHPIWNVWQENYQGTQPAFKPVSMQPDSRYLVTLNLAALSYSRYEPAVYWAGVDNSFEEWSELNKEKDNPLVTIFAMPDERYFDPLTGSDRVQPLTIHLKKLREAKKLGFSLQGSPFEDLKRLGDEASFSFGMTSFVFKTKPNVAGNASISFSVWDRDKPITEVSYSTCIGSTGSSQCAAGSSVMQSLRGVDLSNRSNTPDAALHFIELGTDQLVGVFRCNTCQQERGRFFGWKLRGGTSWFHQQFEKTVLGGIRLASNGPDAPDVTRPGQSVVYNENNFKNAADAMYGLLFLSDGAEPTEAETAFQSFVAEKISNRSAGQPPPSLFVRFIPEHPDQAFVVPLGLMRVPVTARRSEYVGFHFRVQTPLPRQDYSNPGLTLSKWTVLVPPGNLTPAVNPLATARGQFKEWIELLAEDKAHSTVYTDIDKFGSWLKLGFQPPFENQVVMILSHHDQKLNTLFIDQSSSVIFPTNMRRHFANPSVAIIDACGAADPGAFEWVKNFNVNGMNTVIASSIEVDARMGGDFLRLLAEQLNAKPTDNTYTIDQAFFDAIAKLRLERDGTEPKPIRYGPRALIYNLVGSANVHVQIVSKSKNSQPSGSPK